ncbi:sensor domain-containing diguanylate cyclase [Cupriavidus metallidurans]|uniref:sensor domain-containing diguanylate cyclase n=1 Tax=Cupriavidus TaxID=106589 RepID=UPI00257E8FBE|nr:MULTISPECIES: sensor domain-containing diguanylate cyclase [unclassified Cupriavidus]
MLIARRLCSLGASTVIEGNGLGATSKDRSARKPYLELSSKSVPGILRDHRSIKMAAASMALSRSIEYSQRHLSLNVRRGLLLLFLLIQAASIGAYLMFERARIENDTVRVLRNTALLKAEQFDTSLQAMRYQLRVVGDAVLLNRDVPIADAEPFLERELAQGWLDAVFITNANGDIIGRSSIFPVDQALLDSFREGPVSRDLRQPGVNERLFFWRGNTSHSDSQGFLVYRAVYDAEGRYLGSIIGYLANATLKRRYLQIEIRGFDLGAGGVVTVVDRDSGHVLARMGGYPPLPGYADASVARQMVLAGDTALQVHRFVSLIDGVRRYGVFLNINQGRWVMVVAASDKAFLHGWHMRAWLGAGAFLAMAVLQWMLLHYANDKFLQRERLARQAQYDPLTELANRRRFDEWARVARSQARRHGQPLSVMSFDLDFFKRVNDTYGHDGGDAVLRHVARLLRSALREGDIAARFGGEEFVAALTHASLKGAVETAERIRARIAAEPVTFNGQSIAITISVGVAQITSEELAASDSMAAALARADHALYQSKKNGRNRVSVASPMAVTHNC